ncbi:MAG: bifunctional UDP-N-acetylglucosamine diphosphorylase/glucosamine-1-phosphate N-acetyltransferase GlmU, partial [Acinetobacter junii]
EYYLTDIVAMAVADGLEIASIQPELAFEVEGVNDRLQLATLERQFQQQQAKELMQQGVHLIDPNRFDLRGTLKCGQDVQIDVNVIIEGHCELGDNVQLGAGCILKNTRIAAGTKVQAYSIFENAVVGENTQIGPFARLRPGANLANDVHIGNFVEVKNSNIGVGSKANHFTYLGDADIGADCNIGAGTITCNYDGANKHRTIIEDHVFIGTNNSLVAPIKIGTGATTGAGSTLTRDVTDHSLAVERSKQFEKANYQRPQKLKK